MEIYNHRFPIEPQSDRYTPNQYNINSSGYPPFYDDAQQLPINTIGCGDIHIIGGEYEDGNIQLSRNDNKTIDIDIKELSEWAEYE